MSKSSETPSGNVKQSVPFFMVTDMEASLRFYVDGLGFRKTMDWTPHGRVEWCWLEHGGAAIMLQEYRAGLRPDATARRRDLRLLHV